MACISSPVRYTSLASDFGYLHFWVNGLLGGQSQRRILQQRVIVGSTPLISTLHWRVNTYHVDEVKVPIGDFALPAGQQIDGVVFQSTSGGVQNLLCWQPLLSSAVLLLHPPPPPSPPPSSFIGTKNSPNGPYSVSGNKILDKDGQEHIFRGWARPSLEWVSIWREHKHC